MTDSSPNLRLLAVLAHPDDESMGMGSTFIKYSLEGIQSYLVCATRGERGWNGPAEEFPGLQALGHIREGELRAAAEVLGIREVEFLDYIDGDLDQANPQEAIACITSSIRRIRPHVVVTFDPAGAYGHPDHIAISQFTSAAVVCAADSSFQDPVNLPAYRVSKLYYMTFSPDSYHAYLELFGDFSFPVDGVQRQAVMWFDWASTTLIDATDHWEAAWQAVCCHQTQLAGFGDLNRITDDQHRRLWGAITYYRAYSLVNGGRKLETDLFEGLR
jgi:LmbE family N-acetylglucosaminyl deacetylase